ncbi:cystatin-like [Scophthalmus maximus]|uniref:cystatin-like n=1 Tax=Scophthalmus maximus TaxID=52904 RepID=UPI0015E0D0E0|nr:cystatin-like [Scophthalmus maximus]XP_047191072.1 cystatin-like [Scophthalmus maximus]
MLVLLCVFVCASGGRVMTGEPRRVPADSAEVLAAARFAVLEFNRAVDDGEPFEIVNVTSAKMQVVAGINYILEVQLGRATCRSGGHAAHSEPRDPTPAKTLQCNFVVTEIPWEDSRALTQTRCRPPQP